MSDSEPFGQRTVRLGFATSEQVRMALQTQAMLAEKSGLLGEILVEMGWLDPQDYMRLVQELSAKETPGDRSHEEIQKRFAECAVTEGYVDGEKMTQARKIQSSFTRKNRLIGQIMLEMEFLTSEQCRQVIETYPNDE